jgi:hypothetical protein
MTTAIFAFILPVTVVSEANARCHWRARHKRFTEHKLAVRIATAPMLPPEASDFPLTVTLVRIGGRRMDDDNLAGSMKAIRDAVAGWLRVDDGAAAVRWAYRQTGKGRGQPPGCGWKWRRCRQPPGLPHGEQPRPAEEFREAVRVRTGVRCEVTAGSPRG